MKNRIQLYNEDCFIRMKQLEDCSIDIICIDPPYLYLKHKLDKPFDEELFFSECKRLLTKDGFIVMFGRGASFYRWGSILDSLKFTFKEEIVWDKSQGSSPLLALTRVHETVSVWTKGKGVINKVKIPYLEMKGHDINSICSDIKRMKAVLNNTDSIDAVKYYLKNRSHMNYEGRQGSGVTISSSIKSQNRCASVFQTITEGFNEKSIIKQVRDHYTSIHPTQKPVRLLERLLQLVIPKDKEIEDVLVADFFGGSFSTMEATYNLGMSGLSTEIDKEYYDLGFKRIKNLSLCTR